MGGGTAQFGVQALVQGTKTASTSKEKAEMLAEVYERVSSDENYSPSFVANRTRDQPKYVQTV